MTEAVYVSFTSLPFSWVLASFAIGAVMSFAASPFARRLAILIGAIDVPRDSRRMHRTPIPRLGGVAMLIGFTTATLCFVPYMNNGYYGILAGAAVLMVGGVLDDIYDLRPWQKFLFQLAASGTAVACGVRIEVLSNIFLFSDAEYISLGIFSIPVTMGWILLIVNAVNLLDGLDGLADGVASISSITLMIIAILFNDAVSAVLTAALAGACIGFMPFNFNPARIFMGETGASFLGFVLACVSVLGLFKMYAVVSIAVPFLILGLPIFEITYSALRRILSGQSPTKPDKKHLHHRLMEMGLTQKKAVVVIYAFCMMLCGCAIAFVAGGARVALLVICICFVLAAGVGMWLLNATPIVLYRKLKIFLISLRSKDAGGGDDDK